MRERETAETTVVVAGRRNDESFTQEEYQSLRERFNTRGGDPSCHIGVTIEPQSHGTVEGVLVTSSLSYPNFRFSDGKHGFISCGDAEEMRLLFQHGYEGRRGPPYKYPINDLKLTIDWYNQPTCPSCDTEMVYGRSEWDPIEKHDGYTHGWLCPEEFPARIDRGLY